MEQIFDEQRIALFRIKNIVGLVAIAAQARLDFKGGGADARIDDEKLETRLESGDVGGGLHLSERRIRIHDDLRKRFLGGAGKFVRSAHNKRGLALAATRMSFTPRVVGVTQSPEAKCFCKAASCCSRVMASHVASSCRVGVDQDDKDGAAVPAASAGAAFCRGSRMSLIETDYHERRNESRDMN